jgi:hypothetical protein
MQDLFSVTILLLLYFQDSYVCFIVTFTNIIIRLYFYTKRIRQMHNLHVLIG